MLMRDTYIRSLTQEKDEKKLMNCCKGKKKFFLQLKVNNNDPREKIRCQWNVEIFDIHFHVA